MKSFFPLRRLWPAACLFACAAAHATRPMVVDDASIADPGVCQLEAWSQRNANQTEYWAMPACNVGGTWELAAGAGRIGADSVYRAGVFQAKTMFRPLTTDGWGIGLTLANQFRQGAGLAGDLSALVPVSLSLLGDRVLVHLNGGVTHARAGAGVAGLWAAGAEWAARPGLVLTLEAYGSAHAPSWTQAGTRIAILPDRLAFDAGIGRRAARLGAEHYVTFGLTLAGPVLRR